MTAPREACSEAASTRGSVEIRCQQQPRRFLDLQRTFYRNDPHFVPPLAAAESWQIDPRRNPWFQHGRAEFFVAWRDGSPVGRISVARDRMHDDFHGDRVGFFGHFEAADEDTALLLLERAEQWVRRHGATELRGPVDLSTNYRCGLLVEGEPGPPVMMMPHNPPRYAEWIERSGMTKAKDLLALMVEDERLAHGRLDRVVTRLQQKSGSLLRRMDLGHFDRELATLWDLYHRIWERNWGFCPMSRAEFESHAKDLKKVAHPALMHIAEVEGQPVGFAVGLPDVNLATRACRGRLLPFGWLRFLRALKRANRIRAITLGVVPEFRKKGVEMQLLHGLIRQGIGAGFHSCEASWILEDNKDMLGPLETLGGRYYRRYRIFTKALS
jgi:GNAT superfamily N-acetyltransferase